ncbi:MAG: hypothetical protein HY744_06775 [Deltaproteobacteria bacterium]|nr:hypothetical protein [Deltaproteobacteria bacterium]
MPPAPEQLIALPASPEGPPIALERFAALSAELDAGADHSGLLARAGLTDHQWAAAQRIWLSRIAGEATGLRLELAGRYAAAFAAERRELEKRHAAPVEAAPAAPVAPANPPAPSKAEPPPAPVAPPPAPPAPRPRAPRAQTAPMAAVAPGPALPFAASPPARDRPAAQCASTADGTTMSPVAAMPFAPTAVPLGRSPAGAPALPFRDRRACQIPARPEPAPARDEHAAECASTAAGTIMSPVAAMPFAPAATPPGRSPAGAPALPFVPAERAAPPPPAASAPPGDTAAALLAAPGGTMGCGNVISPFAHTPLPFAPPAPPSAPGSARAGPAVRLSLEQYASLEAELAVAPAARDRTLGRYGLDATGYAAEQAAWRSRLAGDSALRDRCEALGAQFRGWLEAMRR